jgi:predicted transcriptional regulator
MRSISAVLREDMIPAMEEMESKLAQIKKEINQQKAA